MAEVDTDVEGVEAEVNSYQADQAECKDRDGRRRGGRRGRKGDCNDELKEILKQLATDCEQVTISLQSGSKCCKLTGCICDVDDCFVELLAKDDPCERTYILLDCICAVENCVEGCCSYDDKCE